MIQKGCRESDGQVRQGTVPPSVSVKTPVQGEWWTGVLLYGKTIYAREELLEPVEIAKDEILILVGEKNPLQNITMDQLTKIYRGDISQWSDLAE